MQAWQLWVKQSKPREDNMVYAVLKTGQQQQLQSAFFIGKISFIQLKKIDTSR